tara:strand:- start:1445 stop:1738 length:294 start_codon:yes stop_codon:yes gene_type:complete
MSKTNEAMIDAQHAVREVADEAFKRLERQQLLFDSFPNMKIHSRSTRFSQMVLDILIEQDAIEANNPFIMQVAYMYDKDNEDFYDDEEIRRSGSDEG